MSEQISRVELRRQKRAGETSKRRGKVIPWLMIGAGVVLFWLGVTFWIAVAVADWRMETVQGPPGPPGPPGPAGVAGADGASAVGDRCIAAIEALGAHGGGDLFSRPAFIEARELVRRYCD